MRSRIRIWPDSPITTVGEYEELLGTAPTTYGFPQVDVVVLVMLAGPPVVPSTAAGGVKLAAAVEPS